MAVPSHLFALGPQTHSSLMLELGRTYSQIYGADLAPTYVHAEKPDALCALLRSEQSCVDAAASPSSSHPMVDWINADCEIPDELYDTVPDLQLYPTSAVAVVPIYNLPNHTATDPPLVLAADVLADIFLTALTRWDDPRIVATNPALVARGKLPVGPIQVIVRSSISGVTEMFRRSLAKFDNGSFAAEVGISASASWGNASVLTCASTYGGTSPCVLRTPLSIGYALLTDVLELSLPAASIAHEGGAAVSATTSSIADALIEFGGRFGNDGSDSRRLTMDITGARSASAWPISGLLYMMLRKESTAFTGDERCTRRLETVEFWHWYFSSEAARVEAEDLGHVILTPGMRQHVLDRLETDVECDGERVYTARSVVRGGGAEWLAPAMTRAVNLYPAAIASYESLLMDAAHEQVHEGTLDYATFHDDDLTAQATHYTEDAHHNDIVVLPFRLFAISIAVSFCDVTSNETCALANRELVLSLEVLAAITGGNLTRWLDPRMVALNPWMGVAPYASAIGVEREIVLIGQAATSDTNELFLHKLRRHVPTATLRALDRPTATVIIEPSSSRVAARVVYEPFSLGIVPHILEYGHLNFASIASPFNALLAVAPSVESLLACTRKAPGDASASWHVEDNDVAECYPLSDTLVIATPRSYHGADCARGESTLLFLQWLARGELSQSHTHMLSYIELQPSIVRQQLAAITCDGASILESRIDIKQPLGSTLNLLVYVPATLLTAFFVVCTTVFVLYRHTATMKAAQNFFLSLTSLGCLLLISVSLIAILAHDEARANELVPIGEAGRYPEFDRRCCAQLWLYFVGTTLTHAPLVVKLWRVTLVLVNPSLRNVNVQKTHFVKYIGALVFVDLILLMVWTIVAPPFYRVKVFAPEADGGTETWHTSCDYLPTGSHGLAIALVLKQCALVAVGLRLCNRARHLEKLYSDAQAMSFILTGHVERTLIAILLGWYLSPFAFSGSPTGFFILVWLVILANVVSAAIFVFGWRLVTLWDELRSPSLNVLAKRSEATRRPVPSTVLSRKPPLGAAPSVVASGRLPLRFGSLLRPQGKDRVSPAPGRTNPSTTPCTMSSDLAGNSNTVVHYRSAAQTDDLAAMLARANDEIEELREDNTELRSRNLDLVTANQEILARLQQCEHNSSGSNEHLSIRPSSSGARKPTQE